MMKSISVILLSLLMSVSIGAADDYCFDDAANIYGISPYLLKAISWVESRHEPGALNINANGSSDFGHMQINSLWVSVIGQTYLGLDDPCFCTKVGAFILSGCIEKHGYNSDALSCYNSGRPISKLDGQTLQDVITYVRRVEARYLQLTK